MYDYNRSLTGIGTEVVSGQLADQPTRCQSSRGLDNSRTSQLADSEFLKKHGITILYLVTVQTSSACPDLPGTD